MMSDFGKFKEIVEKLRDRTRRGRVQWETLYGGFRSTVGDTSRPNQQYFTFTLETVGQGSEPVRSFSMLDEKGHEILRVISNDLPTSAEEEETSTLLNELYEMARRQALKVDEKLESASTLLDRV